MPKGEALHIWDAFRIKWRRPGNKFNLILSHTFVLTHSPNISARTPHRKVISKSKWIPGAKRYLYSRCVWGLIDEWKLNGRKNWIHFWRHYDWKRSGFVVGPIYPSPLFGLDKADCIIPFAQHIYLFSWAPISTHFSSPHSSAFSEKLRCYEVEWRQFSMSFGWVEKNHENMRKCCYNLSFHAMSHFLFISCEHTLES